MFLVQNVNLYLKRAVKHYIQLFLCIRSTSNFSIIKITSNSVYPRRHFTCTDWTQSTYDENNESTIVQVLKQKSKTEVKILTKQHLYGHHSLIRTLVCTEGGELWRVEGEGCAETYKRGGEGVGGTEG